jgi:hypothetical protein
LVTQRQQVILQENELQVVQVRSMPYLKQVTVLPTENKTKKPVALIEQ